MRPKAIMAALCALALLTGCNTTRDATRSKIVLDVNKLARTGKLEIQSPKDIALEQVTIQRDGENFRFSIGRYSAVVSQAAVEAAKAEVESNRATFAELIGFMKLLLEKAAASQGVPQSQAGATTATLKTEGGAKLPMRYNQTEGVWEHARQSQEP